MTRVEQLIEELKQELGAHMVEERDQLRANRDHWAEKWHQAAGEVETLAQTVLALQLERDSAKEDAAWWKKKHAEDLEGLALQLKRHREVLESVEAQLRNRTRVVEHLEGELTLLERTVQERKPEDK